MHLCDIDRKSNYVIKKINSCDSIKRRLYDIGLCEGTKVNLVFISKSKRIKAYLIRDSIIAIRNKDASLIEVEIYD